MPLQLCLSLLRLHIPVYNRSAVVASQDIFLRGRVVCPKVLTAIEELIVLKLLQ